MTLIVIDPVDLVDRVDFVDGVDLPDARITHVLLLHVSWCCFLLFVFVLMFVQNVGNRWLGCIYS